MSEPEKLRAAVAAGAFAAERARSDLLQSIVDAARAIFAARASTIMIHDRKQRELVFAAVSGEGAELVGTRIPDSTGISGWVLSAREPIVLEDVVSDPRFARDFASSTGYVPKGFMAAPLLRDESALGVLSVLDRPQQPGFTLSEMDLLGLFSHQAALALEMSEGAGRARAVLQSVEPELEDLAILAELIGGLDGRQREQALALIGALRAVLGALC